MNPSAHRKLVGCLVFLLVSTSVSSFGISSNEALIFLDFEQSIPAVSKHEYSVSKGKYGRTLEFTRGDQFYEIPSSNQFQDLRSLTIGGWFFPRLAGEQSFIARGLPETGQNGDRLFPRKTNWVNFLLGTDQRGFLMGVINGNAQMPFPQVSVSEVAFDAWNQLVLVKTPMGFHRLYHNGVLVHEDLNAQSGGKFWPFSDTASGESIFLRVPLGGLIGEAWIFPRELTAQEIAADFQEKRNKYNPAIQTPRQFLREMNQHPQAGLWKTPPTNEIWPQEQNRLKLAAKEILGAAPNKRVPLKPLIISETDCGTYLRRKLTLQVEEDDRMPLYLLIPKSGPRKKPAVICFYGTSGGAGKETTVGLSGRNPGTPGHANMSFAIDMAEAGFVAAAPDYLRDGERLPQSKRPYDTGDFYAKHPNWSIHGKDAWDTSRLIDYLESLPQVDPTKIGMTGHSYGGHSTIFAAAMDPRIAVAVANGPVSDFLHHGMHWGVPKGAGNSQSLPNLRPYVMDHTLPLPITFYEFTALIAPRPLLVGQAAGERRPFEEENYAAVKSVYTALGKSDRVHYHWYGGDHDYPPEARAAAVNWFKKWFSK